MFGPVGAVFGGFVGGFVAMRSCRPSRGIYRQYDYSRGGGGGGGGLGARGDCPPNYAFLFWSFGILSVQISRQTCNLN